MNDIEKIVFKVTDLNDLKKKIRKLKRNDLRKLKIKNINHIEEIDIFEKVFNLKNDKERYCYIYNYMCAYLDSNICNLCDFSDNKCIGNRMNKSVHNINGCCYFRGEGFCKFFIDKHCTKKSLSCKLFICPTIEKKIGFKSIPNNYLLINYFFNCKQKELLRHSYRKNIEDIIDKLLELK